MKWYLHEQHGYMVLDDGGYGCSALCQNTRLIQQAKEDWDKHESKLKVNAGSGAVAVFYFEGEPHDNWKEVEESSVPEFIRERFLKELSQ